MFRAWPVPVLMLAVAACHGDARRRQPPDMRTLASSREFAGEKQLDAHIQFGGGTLTLKPAPAGTLYRASLQYDARRLTPAINYQDGQLNIGMKNGNVAFGGKHHRGNQLDVQLGTGVPLNLNVEYGAGSGDIELGGLTVSSARIATGASKTQLSISSPTVGDCQSLELQAGAAKVQVRGLGNLSPHSLRVEGGVGDLDLDFSGAWRGDTDAAVNMGMGSLRLNVPRGVGLRVHKSTVLAKLEGSGLNRQGDNYVSQGYEKTSRHLNVEINAAFGSIHVNWIGDGSSF